MKTKIFTFVMLAFIGWSTANAQVGIGTTTPEPSSVLDVTSTEKGFLPPRLSTSERNAIASPAEGLTIYNTTVNCLQWYNGTGWFDGCSGLEGAISSLDCANATNNGTLVDGAAATDVNSVISYTGGNGGTHSGQVVASSGVTGLTATLSAGNFASGNGTLTYTITGVPSGPGTATFNLNIGGQSCLLSRAVNNANAVATSENCSFNSTGTFVEGLGDVSGFTQTIRLNVTQVGNYDILATNNNTSYANPVSWIASGTFNSTGQIDVVLAAINTTCSNCWNYPDGTNTYTVFLNGSSICTFQREVISGTAPPFLED